MHLNIIACFISQQDTSFSLKTINDEITLKNIFIERFLKKIDTIYFKE